jgi:hypothetical protein
LTAPAKRDLQAAISEGFFFFCESGADIEKPLQIPYSLSLFEHLFVCVIAVRFRVEKRHHLFLPYPPENENAHAARTDDSLQLHGGDGYINECYTERCYPDAKIVEIYEAAKEMGKATIAKLLLGKF